MCMKMFLSYLSMFFTGPDLRGQGDTGPKHPTNRRPPIKPFIFYFSLVIDAYETTT